MKTLLIACTALLLTAGLYAQNTVTNLSATVFAQKLKELPKAILVDVRTPEEFAKGHLANAININWNAPDFTTHIEGLDKSATVLLYCQSGRRSAEAATKMRSLGFSEVLELQGGILKWRESRLPEEAPLPSKNITPQQFASLINKDKTVLVDVYADWCGPCRQMKPHVEKVEKEMGDKLQVVRINSDDNPELVRSLQIEALPTLLVYKNGKLKQVSIGYINKAAILKLVK